MIWFSQSKWRKNYWIIEKQQQLLDREWNIPLPFASSTLLCNLNHHNEFAWCAFFHNIFRAALEWNAMTANVFNKQNFVPLSLPILVSLISMLFLCPWSSANNYLCFPKSRWSRLSIFPVQSEKQWNCWDCGWFFFCMIRLAGWMSVGNVNIVKEIQ